MPDWLRDGLLILSGAAALSITSIFAFSWALDYPNGMCLIEPNSAIYLIEIPLAFLGLSFVVWLLVSWLREARKMRLKAIE